MSKTKQTPKKLESDHHMADVLYQRLGTTWYAFAEVGGEMYVSKVDEDSIETKFDMEELEKNEEFFFEAVNGKPASRGTDPRAA